MVFRTHSSRYKYCPKYCSTFWNRGALFLVPCCCNLSKLYPESPVSRIYDQSFHLWLSFFKVLFGMVCFLYNSLKFLEFGQGLWAWCQICRYGCQYGLFYHHLDSLPLPAVSTKIVVTISTVIATSGTAALLPSACSFIAAWSWASDKCPESWSRWQCSHSVLLSLEHYELPIKGYNYERQWTFDQKDLGMACWLSRL